MLKLTTVPRCICVELHSVNFIGIADKRTIRKKCVVSISGKCLKLYLHVLSGSAIKMVINPTGFS